jgi:hypothetical protein
MPQRNRRNGLEGSGHFDVHAELGMSTNLPATLDTSLAVREQGDAGGNFKTPIKMTCAIHSSLEPGEALLCASNCNSLSLGFFGESEIMLF